MRHASPAFQKFPSRPFFNEKIIIIIIIRDENELVIQLFSLQHILFIPHHDPICLPRNSINICLKACGFDNAMSNKKYCGNCVLTNNG